jgi:putative transposase
MAFKAFKYRIYPNQKQTKILEMNFGCKRFMWNALTANFNTPKDQQIKNLSEKEIKEQNPFLKEAISYALQQVRMDFFEAMKQFFNKKRKKRVGRMKFKKKGVCNDSFRIPAQSIGYSKGVDFEKGYVNVKKSMKIKCVFDRTFTGEIKSLTFSKNKCGQYFVSILVDVGEIKHHPKTGNDIGIDLGVKDLLTLSNGIKFENPKLFRENQTKLKTAQKHLSRKKHGSNRYNKQKLKMAKIHRDITNQRNWYYHNITSTLVKEYDSICIENLNVSGMLKNHKLAKAIQECSFSTFTNMLKYKADWYGKEVLQVGQFYPSSKTCSRCDHKMDKMELSIREWKCPSCGCVHDRDLNAAINIKNKCLEETYGIVKTSKSAELTDYIRGEAVRREDFLSGKSVHAFLDEANNLASV